jgi:hypothetical protein
VGEDTGPAAAINNVTRAARFTTTSHPLADIRRTAVSITAAREERTGEEREDVIAT